MAYHGLGCGSLGTALPGASVTVSEIAEDVCGAGVRSVAICAVVIARRNGHTQVVDASSKGIQDRDSADATHYRGAVVRFYLTV